MKKIATLVIAATLGLNALAQTTITNGGFESWGNTVPSGDTHTEPTNWYSNQSGSTIAALGGQTCFQESSIVHSGSYSVRVETISTTIILIGTIIVNGNVTTGVVNAPTTTKSDGYIGTINYTTSSDDRRMAFTGHPDSIVGWYQYQPGGGSEQGKIRAILHIGDYNDPETPTTSHPDMSANKIADALFHTPMATVSTWTRFSVPFTYVSTSSPAYIMINITSSADQATTTSGSKLWVDDLEVIYNPPAAVKNIQFNGDGIRVYAADKTIFVDFPSTEESQSLLSISDMSGKVVATQNISNTQLFSFYLSQPTGIYTYRLSNAGYCLTGKFFLQ